MLLWDKTTKTFNNIRWALECSTGAGSVDTESKWTESITVRTSICFSAADDPVHTSTVVSTLIDIPALMMKELCFQFIYLKFKLRKKTPLRMCDVENPSSTVFVLFVSLQFIKQGFQM